MSQEKLFTIGDVSQLLKIEKHVLRFWENNFPLLSPKRVGGSHRYYTPEDITMLEGIRTLLKHHGYTTKGVQKLLRKKGKSFLLNIADGSVELSGTSASSHMAILARHLHTIRSLRKEIVDIT